MDAERVKAALAELRAATVTGRPRCGHCGATAADAGGYCNATIVDGTWTGRCGVQHTVTRRLLEPRDAAALLTIAEAATAALEAYYRRSTVGPEHVQMATLADALAGLATAPPDKETTNDDA